MPLLAFSLKPGLSQDEIVTAYEAIGNLPGVAEVNAFSTNENVPAHGFIQLREGTDVKKLLEKIRAIQNVVIASRSTSDFLPGEKCYHRGTFRVDMRYEAEDACEARILSAINPIRAIFNFNIVRVPHMLAMNNNPGEATFAVLMDRDIDKVGLKHRLAEIPGVIKDRIELMAGQGDSVNPGTINARFLLS